MQDDDDVIALTSLLMSFGFEVIPKLKVTMDDGGSRGGGGGGGGGGNRGVAIDRIPAESLGSDLAEFQREVRN